MKLARYRNGFFKDKYEIKYYLDKDNLLERQMAAAGYWEEDTSVFIEKIVKTGDVVMEVGANFGAHTLPLAKKIGASGKIYAFEPMDYGFKRLNDNLSLNPDFQNVTVLKTFIGAKNKEKIESEITSRWSVRADGNDTSIQQFVSATIDSYLVEVGHVDVLKIDVDGGEYNVLDGARRAIELFRPIMYVEVSKALYKFGSDPSMVCEFLRSYGYALHIFDLRKRTFVRSSTGDVVSMLRFQPVCNVLALQSGRRLRD
jgi:FkbM family methyltransferase